MVFRGGGRCRGLESEGQIDQESGATKRDSRHTSLRSPRTFLAIVPFILSAESFGKQVEMEWNFYTVPEKTSSRSDPSAHGSQDDDSS